MRTAVWCATLLISGCLLDNASSARKLNDAVLEMNKATRWGQLSLAAQMVEPIYRAQFMENHAHWGAIVQVADSEVVHVEMVPGEDSAIAMVAYSWYMTSSMTLHQTVVRQRWSRSENGYALLSEVVVRGDGRLLAPNGEPPKSEPMRDPLMGRADG